MIDRFITFLRLYWDFFLKRVFRWRLDSERLPFPIISRLIVGNKGRFDVLLLGDSVSERVSVLDENRATLPDMLRKNLGSGRTILSVTHSAYNVEVYDLIIRTCFILQCKPRIILVPLNLRSFSPQWFHNPLFQCAGHKKQLRSFLIKNGMSIGQQYLTRESSVCGFLNHKVSLPGMGMAKIRDLQLAILLSPKNEAEKMLRKRVIFSYHYLPQIKPDHELIHACQSMASYVREAGSHLIYYITPINCAAGAKHVGSQFNDIVGANISLIASALKSTRVFDFSALLPSDCFFSVDDATEHLNETGRVLLANKLTEICDNITL